jgi:hypothetical protein
MLGAVRRSGSFATLALLLGACGGLSSENVGTDGAAAKSAGSPSRAGAGPSAEAVGGSGASDNLAGNGSGNAAGSAAPHTALPELCESSYYWCCDRDDGHEVPSTCGPDERWLPCAGNSFHPNGEPTCMPDSVSVADCQALDGLACEPGNECHNLRPCSTHCTCAVMGGGYLWQCSDYAC